MTYTCLLRATLGAADGIYTGGKARLLYCTEGGFYGGQPPNPRASLRSNVIVLDWFLQYSLTLYLLIQPNSHVQRSKSNETSNNTPDSVLTRDTAT